MDNETKPIDPLAVILAIIIVGLLVFGLGKCAEIMQPPVKHIDASAETFEQTIAPGEIANIEFCTNGTFINDTMRPVTFKVTTYEDGSQTIEAVSNSNFTAIAEYEFEVHEDSDNSESHVNLYRDGVIYQKDPYMPWSY